MYTIGAMKNDILVLQDKVLEVLKDKLGDFALAGGTALARCYFKHRESDDLDFFSSKFIPKEVERIVSFIGGSLKREMKLDTMQLKGDFAKYMRFYVGTGRNKLKIEFVEDVYRRLKSHSIIDGIPVFSREDIYLRKIYAACGIRATEDHAGRKIFLGGRQEAKDFFDIYFLSYAFIPLSEFAEHYCNEVEKESIITWYRNYNRQEMKLGLLESIKTTHKVDFQEVERHFRTQIETIIKKELP